MDRPKSEADARAHIEEIKKSRGLRGPDDNIKDLEAALDLLSIQLYQQATHFLLELIQNADDNSYTRSKNPPTLRVSYSNKHLLFTCNEDGFTRRNVDAICKIGRSTKTGRDGEEHQIGEKGIGFKSVFKVANVVWIKSGCYSFSFDRHQKLGMVAPVWATFPKAFAEDVPKGHTSILLQLSPTFDEEELLDDMRNFDPASLVFLQKLETLHLSFAGHGARSPWRSSFVKHTSKSISIGLGGPFKMVEVQQDSICLQYLVTEHAVVEDSPVEPHRPSRRSRTTIQVAFPLHDGEPSQIKPQNVFAFLPIRDYGFKFLLQADFHLIASREDIDKSSARNQAILEACPAAILSAIQNMNSHGQRSLWPRMVSSRPPITDFFADVDARLIQLLSKHRILESASGELQFPRQLRYVPLDFRDNEGLLPLTLSADTGLDYLAHLYHADDLPFLRRLGVTEMTAGDFIRDLRKLVETHGSRFRAKPQEWHSSLGQALSTVMARDNQMISDIRGIQIVPLADGRWTTAASKTIMFPSEPGGLQLPANLPVFEVHPEAAFDLKRRQCFTVLGIRDFNRERICRVIADIHDSSALPSASFQVADVISHTLFVFRAGWTDLSKKKLWFVAEDGSFHRGEDLYVDRSCLEGLPRSFSRQIRFLHPHYQLSMHTDEYIAWKDWVTRIFSVNDRARLATPVTGSSFDISPEFQALLGEWTGLETLSFIKTNWTHYKSWIEPSNCKDGAWEESRCKIIERLGVLEVKCLGGDTKPLKNTTLPLRFTRTQASALAESSFIDVPKPDDPGWLFLTYLGVSGQQDVDCLLQHLAKLKASDQASTGDVVNIYRQINICYGPEDLENLRLKFDELRFVYVPASQAPKSGRWCRPNQCVWEGGQHLRRTPVLKAQYEELRDFFCNVLRVEDETLTTVETELRQVEASDRLESILDLFKAISSYAEQSKGLLHSTVDTSLKDHEIFPITSPSLSCTFESLRSGLGNEIWFIADRHHLRESFEGVVSLLAFGVNDVARIAPGLRAMGLENRLLSKQVENVTKVKGSSGLHPRYTADLRRRARFIVSLLPDTTVHQDKERIAEQLRLLEVHQADEVMVESRVNTPEGLTIEGKVSAGRVKLVVAPDSGRLIIYLTRRDLDAALPPYDLCEAIQKFYGIFDPETAPLLQQVLLPQDESSIIQLFERRGLIITENLSAGNHDVEDVGEFGRTADMRGTDDHLLRLIREVEGAAHAGRCLNRRLEQNDRADVGPILAQLCRFNNQDASLLLPGDSEYMLQARRRATPCLDGAQILEYRHLSEGESLSDGILSGESVVWPAVFVSSKEHSSVVVFGNEDEEAHDVDIELAFLGEYMVSRLFESHIGAPYQPRDHWTSLLRTRAGYQPCGNLHDDASTFTIRDATGAFTQFLADLGYKGAKKGISTRTYHVQVMTTTTELLGSEFLLSGAAMRKAETLWLKSQSHGSSADVFVLAVVADARKDFEVGLFVDPWDLHTRGKLRLGNAAHYTAQFKSDVPYLALRKPTTASTDDEVEPSRAGFLSGLWGSSRATAPKQKLPSFGNYRYKPFKSFREIRLLKLHPGKNSEPLEGALEHCCLGTASYTAISYQWGSNMSPFEIKTPEGTVCITGTLHSALRHIRDPRKSILVWADAVCINQNDDHEKTIQIRHMREIYQFASKVCAFIGEGDNASVDALETLMQIRAAAQHNSRPDPPPLWEGRETPPDNDLVWEDIKAVLSRGWFRRAWITQELVLATQVDFRCGDWHQPWEHVFDAIRICMAEENPLSQGDTGLTFAYNLGFMRESFKNPLKQKHCDLLAVLELFSHTQSTHPADKLFALLGLACDASDAAFDPDYDSPLEFVARRYASVFVNRGQAARLLCRAGLSKGYPFASWIPNWTGGPSVKSISTWHGRNGLFAASGSLPIYAQVGPESPDQGTLRVEGRRIDKIKSRGPISLNEADLITFLNSIYQSIDSLPHPYPTGELPAELKHAIPIGHTSRPHLDRHLDAKVREVVRDALPGDAAELPSTLPDINTLQGFLDANKEPRDKRLPMWNFWHTANSFATRLGNGRFIGTERGYGGMGPGCVGVGD
ncbi:hypothetical protein B0T14DRAFT_339770, partial [Immersiella caudata]